MCRLPPRVRLLLLLPALLSARVALAADAPPSGYLGRAFDAQGEVLQYTEQHYLVPDGGTTRRLVLYRCADGAPFARKWVQGDLDDTMPAFELRDARRGYREGAQAAAAGVSVYAQAAAEAPERRAELSPPADGVIDAGFDAFVRRHWEALATGTALPLHFLVPSELRFLPFRVRRVDAAAPGAATFRLSLGTWYGFMAPHIDVSYEVATQRLSRFSGLSNIRDARGDNLQVRIEFPPTERRAQVDPAEVAAARAAPLDGRCGLRG